MKTKITLEQGVQFVRSLETQLIPHGAHCALGGSVLHKGESQKDIDVFIYPHNQPDPTKNKTCFGLKDVVLKLFPDASLITDTNYPADRLLYRVEQYGWRIELFIFITQKP